MSLKRNLYTAFCLTFIAVMILTFSACFSPWLDGDGEGAETSTGTTGKVTISLGDVELLPSVIQNRLKFKAELNIYNAESVSIAKESYESDKLIPFEMSIKPGDWWIDIKVFFKEDNTDIYAFTSEEVKATVKVDENTTANLTLQHRYKRINNRADLETVSSNLSGSYILGASFDLGSPNWVPIGSDGTRFEGTFDGNGYEISKLYMSTGHNDSGLFGVIGASASVRNLGLKEVDIAANLAGGNRAGGLAGTNRGVIQNCFVTGSRVDGNVAGGLVGENRSTVRNSYAAININSSTGGGLVGLNESSGGVLNTYATGNVTSSANAGGLVGINKGAVQNSYATGNVTGSILYFGGGLVGENNNGLVQNSYATGNVIGSTPGSSGGGLVGINSLGTVRNCVALNNSISAFTNLGRVGNGGTGFSNNHGRSPHSLPTTSNLNAKDGLDLVEGNWYNPSWWGAAGSWNTTDPAFPWRFGANDPWNPPNSTTSILPTLRNMPTGTQTPKVPGV